MKNGRKRFAAVTLLELIVAVAVMGIVVFAMAYAFAGGIDYERTALRQRAESGQVATIERRLTRLIQGARLPEGGEDDDSAYFLGLAESGESALGAERLTFLSDGESVTLAALESADDFETQHEARGPVGGLAEVSLSLTAVGDAGERRGLFERLQRPADGDPDQGGTERVLSDRVVRLGFEFYNGLEWVAAWDTTTGEYRLPAAVRVNYALESDPETLTRRLVVPLPASDVTADDPADTEVTL